MLSRSLAILVSSWLPCFALILPLGRFHTINALVVGTAATVLAALSMVDRRARVGAAILGAWVAFTPFIVRSTFIEIVMAVCWGVAMFAHLIGPFSEEPRVNWVPAPARPAEQPAEQAMRAAA